MEGNLVGVFAGYHVDFRIPFLQQRFQVIKLGSLLVAYLRKILLNN
jgi:hypothetical protein